MPSVRRLCAKLMLGPYGHRPDLSGVESWARTVLDDYDWLPWQKQYHTAHLRRYCAVISLLQAPTKHEQVLEIGALPYGITCLAHARGYTDIVCATSPEIHVDEQLVKRTDQGGHVAHLQRRRSSAVDFRVESFNAEAERWPFPDSSFDGLIMCEVLEHFAIDPMAALSEANRVLKSNGWLLLTTPNGASLSSLLRMLDCENPSMAPAFNPESIYYRHHREYTTPELLALLRSAGFEPESLSTISLERPSVRSLLPVTFLRVVDRNADQRGDFHIGRFRKVGAVIDRRPKQCRLYAES